MNKKQREKLSDYLLDISKLITAGVVIGTIIDFNLNKITILGLGLLASILFAFAGFNYLKKKRK